jgi:hypothetical protein
LGFPRYVSEVARTVPAAAADNLGSVEAVQRLRFHAIRSANVEQTGSSSLLRRRRLDEILIRCPRTHGWFAVSLMVRATLAVGPCNRFMF